MPTEQMQKLNIRSELDFLPSIFCFVQTSFAEASPVTVLVEFSSKTSLTTLMKHYNDFDPGFIQRKFAGSERSPSSSDSARATADDQYQQNIDSSQDALNVLTSEILCDLILFFAFSLGSHFQFLICV
jgi:hypothetical protein